MKNTLCGILVACPFLVAGAVHAAEGPDGDTKHWKTYRVAIGAKAVQFTIPPRESKDLPHFEVPSRIDTVSEGIFDQALIGPSLLERGWDYRKSRFKHVDGSLSAYIGLRRSEKPLVDMTALQEAVKETRRLFAAKKYLASGSPGGSNDPTHFLPARIASREAWKVFYERSSPSYVVTLDASHYLEISLQYGGVTDPESLFDAKAAATAIQESIRIEDAGADAGR